jgi:dTMP kinase
MKRFVTFEGIDGSGKSTIINLVEKELKKTKHSVITTQEPTDTWIGKCVKKCIATNTDPIVTAFIFISDRIIHGKEISSWLETYDIVLSDRYAESTYAYQGAQLESHMNDPMKWLMELSKNRFPIPDHTFLFDIAPEKAMNRIKNRLDLIPFEQVSFLKRVRENYRTLAKGNRFSVLDANQPIEDLLKQCIEVIRI